MPRQETKREKAEIAFFISYSQDRLVYHANLVVPLELLHSDHRRWAKYEFTKPLSKTRFRECLEEAGTKITKNGKGRLRHAVHGVGMRPSPWRNDG